jgi:hypothetical protein
LVGGKRAFVHQLADLQVDRSVIIEGTVGQGKSIFLRYLASVEFCVSKRIPVFLELRKCKSGLSLTTMALQELKALGLEMNEEVFQFFVDQGRILLLLDAFDEVKQELRQDLITEIETLVRQHEALRIIVTSRPQSGISTSNYLPVFQLCPLEGKEYEDVIHRMAHDSGTADVIISGIRKEAAQVAPLLTTPLIVALLVVRYRIDQSLPQNSAAFYESLFSLLLQRHDKTKGGYIRPRKSGASDIQLEDYFSAFCFVTRKADAVSFTRAEMKGFAKETLKITGENFDVDKLIADIIEITCMLITDGEEARFIHKSVQEYHAAVFIKERPDDMAIAFYTTMQTKWSTWQQDLRFLAQIDRYRYLKYLLIVELRSALTVGGGILLDAAPLELLEKVCGGDTLNFPAKPKASGETRATSFYHGATCRSWATMQLVYNSEYGGDMFEIVKAKEELEGINLKMTAEGDSVSISQLLVSAKFKQRIETSCLKFCKQLQATLKEAEAYVAHVESTKSVFQF